MACLADLAVLLGGRVGQSELLDGSSRRLRFSYKPFHVSNKIIHLPNHHAPVESAFSVLENPITELHGKVGEIDQVVECLQDGFCMFFKQLQEFLQIVSPRIFHSNESQPRL
jgi:hypothetical protein